MHFRKTRARPVWPPSEEPTPETLSIHILSLADDQEYGYDDPPNRNVLRGQCDPELRGPMKRPSGICQILSITLSLSLSSMGWAHSPTSIRETVFDPAGAVALHTTFTYSTGGYRLQVAPGTTVTELSSKDSRRSTRENLQLLVAHSLVRSHS
jgi:hypothetical protein